MVEFRTDVFDADTVRTMIERFERVILAITADPSQRLSSMDVLVEAEYARLDRWGNRAVLTQPASTPVSIPAAFAAQVARCLLYTSGIPDRRTPRRRAGRAGGLFRQHLGAAGRPCR